MRLVVHEEQRMCACLRVCSGRPRIRDGVNRHQRVRIVLRGQGGWLRERMNGNGRPGRSVVGVRFWELFPLPLFISFRFSVKSMLSSCGLARLASTRIKAQLLKRIIIVAIFRVGATLRVDARVP